jgi:hypothetical protein
MARCALSRKNSVVLSGSIVVPSVRIDVFTAATRRSTRRTREAARQRVFRSLPRTYEFRYFVDRRGCQHFNFPQTIWLNPRIQMAYTPIQTTALETLAINLLTLAIRGRDCRAPIGYTSKRAMDLVPRFCAECLLASPRNAWVLPRATIKAWADSHRSIKRSRDAGSRNRPKAQ